MNRRNRITIAAFVCAIGALLVVVDLRSRAQNARIEAQRASIETGLRKALIIGDGSQTIEKVLRENALQFTYSEFSHGYYATVATETQDCRIDVMISTTNEKRLLEIQVKSVFTSL
jgi:hypothetical protein